MIVVIFEVRPHPATRQTYLDIAASLGSELAKADGFISVERFQSLADPECLLSLSCWRDEAAVARWRDVESHRRAQELGRASVFQQYRLRIATVVRDYGMNDRTQAPEDSRRRHEQKP